MPTLELITVPLIAFVSILRSRGFQRLTTVVEAHRPLIDALRSHDPELTRDTFGQAAVNPYRPFLGASPEIPVLAAFTISFVEHGSSSIFSLARPRIGFT